jgi:ribonuclease R
MNQPFADDALAEAQQIAQATIEWGRPQVQGITIDGPTSLDLDDAIWVEERQASAILSVHVADVAAYVPIGTALDRDAIAKVHTRYHKASNSPLFPHQLSEAEFSLQEGQLRPTLTLELALGPDGQLKDCKIFESQLISHKRFSYRQADAAMANAADPWHEQLRSCQQWAQRLNQNRRAMGAMGGMETLSGAFLDENGRLVSNSDTRYHSYQVIAECMIAANTAAAQWLAKADCPALYRNHTAKEIAPGQDAMLQALLILGSAQAIRERLQNWLNRAEYSPALIGHFALNLWAYGHFTSPIRRLADLINHRIIKARLRGEAPPYSKLDLEHLSCHINQTILTDEQTVRTSYRNQAKAELQHQLESGQGFADLSAKELSRLLKHAGELLPPALTKEVRSRLTQGRLQVLDYYLLLIKGNNSELQQWLLEDLQKNMQNATSIMSLATTQEDSWSELTYEEQQQGGQFLAWAEVEIDGETQTTEKPGRAARKQVARHQACWQWLEKFAQKDLVGPNRRQRPVDNTVAIIQKEQQALRMQPLEPPGADGSNYVGALLELCQSMGWEKPIFEFEPRAEGFSCVGRLGEPGHKQEGIGIASNKKLAKQRAAMNLLQAMGAATLPR